MSDLAFEKYKERIKRLLIGAGKKGISQNDLHQKTRTKIWDGTDLLNILEEWELQEKVQKFRDTSYTKRPRTIWRATTAILPKKGGVIFVE